MRKLLLMLGALFTMAPVISEARVYCKSTNTGRFCAGLSTDAKPTVAETNDEFFETDTNTVYKYTGAAWTVYAGPSNTELPAAAALADNTTTPTVPVSVLT